MYICVYMFPPPKLSLCSWDHYSSVQSCQLEGYGSSPEFVRPIKHKESTAFCFQAEEQHERSLGTTTMESRWEPNSTTTSLWMENPSYSPWILHPTEQWAERLSVSRIASEATSKADQYTLWSLDASCELNRSWVQG